MKIKSIGTISIMCMLVLSCKKEVVPAYSRERPHQMKRAFTIYPDSQLILNDNSPESFQTRNLPIPIIPDTLRPFPRWPRLPRLPLIPRTPLSLSLCINSYEDLIGILGTNKIQATSVVLDNGVTLSPGPDLAVIWYTAVPHLTGSSLFNSQLQVEWRPDLNTWWSGFTADVWSVGCVYNYSALGSFTNLLKGRTEILINTRFFWSVGEYAGVGIKHIILD